MYECFTNPYAFGSFSPLSNIGKQRPPMVRAGRFPLQFCWPKHAINFKMFTVEPLEPESTIWKRRLEGEICFRATKPIVSLALFKCRFIADSSWMLLHLSRVLWYTFCISSCVSSEVNISSMPIEKPCDENQLFIIRWSEFIKWIVLSAPQSLNSIWTIEPSERPNTFLDIWPFNNTPSRPTHPYDRNEIVFGTGSKNTVFQSTTV